MTGRWPWVLMYHSVGSTHDDPFRVTVSPRRFRTQMEALRRAGRRGCRCGPCSPHRRGPCATGWWA